MFDYKLADAVGFSRDYENLPERIAIEPFHSLADLFAQNIARVKALGMLTMEMNYWSSVMSGAMVQATLVLGKPKLEKNHDQETINLANIYIRQHNEFRSRLTDEDAEKTTINMSSHNVTSMISGDTSGELAAGHEAVLSSMIVEAWSAFEALSVDLWVALLNKHPHPLATSFCRKSEAKSVTLDQLARFNFDLRNRMGDIVRGFSKANFDDLRGIKEAYTASFGVEFDGVLPTGKNLFIAEKTRHLIAHRSGIVDERYLRQCQGVQPFETFTINKRMPLDGAIVAQLVNACVQGGVDLLTWAGQWSVTHG